jgi:hypothetical protein
MRGLPANAEAVAEQNRAGHLRDAFPERHARQIHAELHRNFAVNHRRHNRDFHSARSRLRLMHLSLRPTCPGIDLFNKMQDSGFRILAQGATSDACAALRFISPGIVLFCQLWIRVQRSCHRRRLVVANCCGQHAHDASVAHYAPLHRV